MIYIDEQDKEIYRQQSKTGHWKLEIENGVAVRMYIDKEMQELIGAPDDITPEACCVFFKEHIHPDDVCISESYEAELMKGNAECVYRFISPTLGEVPVRCGGRLIRQEGNVSVIVGYQKDITDTIHFEGGKEESEIRQIRSRDAILKETRQKEEAERRLDQIRGLASQFVMLYFVNLDTLETENYYLDNQVAPEDAKTNDSQSENFFVAFKNIMVTYTHPDYQEEILKYSTPEYMKEVLKNKRRHEVRFPCMNAVGEYEWTDMVIMKFSENEDDEPVNIAVGYYNTDEEMRQRLENERTIKRDLDAIKGLTNEYDTLYFVDLEEDAYSLYYIVDTSPDAAKNTVVEHEKFSDHHNKTLSMFVHPDHLQEMLNFANIDFIRDKLANQNKYTHRFLCDQMKDTSGVKLS